jgi:hypothetical protein
LLILFGNHRFLQEDIRRFKKNTSHKDGQSL